MVRAGLLVLQEGYVSGAAISDAAAPSTSVQVAARVRVRSGW
jgi:hypothetical protein